MSLVKYAQITQVSLQYVWHLKSKVRNEIQDLTGDFRKKYSTMDEFNMKWSSLANDQNYCENLPCHQKC